MNVECLVILHRHGARFPGYKTKDNLCYPSTDKFWEDHGMMLTPTGGRQLYKLGKEMKRHYPIMSQYIPEVFSSYTTRTVMSSLAFLDGAYPERKKYITHDGDRCETIYQTVDEIRVNVEEKKQTDTLFHMGSSADKLFEWRRKNLVASPLIKKEIEDRSIAELLDKLHVMSGSERVSPSLCLTQRLSNITDFNTLIRSTECSNFHLLPNKYGLSLDDQEIQTIKRLSSLVYHHHFCHWSDLTEKEVGSNLCGHLMSSISSFLERGRGVRIYSAHDTTLLAVSASLGFKVPMPNFSAYYVFERCGDRLNIRYNPEPSIHSLSSLPSLKWKKCVKMIECKKEIGSVCLKEFTNRYLHPYYNRLKERLVDMLEGRYRRKIVCSSVVDEVSKSIFDYFDGDRDGYLNEKEFVKMFKRLGIIASKSSILSILCSINKEMVVNERQFLCLVE